MNQSSILLVGDFPDLQDQLQKAKFRVVADPDLDSATRKLDNDWFQLAIVQLRAMNGSIDTERLAWAAPTADRVPKIIVSPQPLDQLTRVVRDTLSNLECPDPAVTFVSEAEGLQVIVDKARQAIDTRIKINQNLKVKPGDEVFHQLANWIMPGTDAGQWVGELSDLFGILFRDCTQIHVDIPPYLKGRRGRITTLWVLPESEIIPRGHPLLVKCGPRESVERIKTSYETYIFRITAARLSGFAQTSHFAAMAFPAPSDQPDMICNFPMFYRHKSVTDICEVIDYLFNQTCNLWHQQTGTPLTYQDKDLRWFYVERLGLKDEEGLRTLISGLSQKASSHNLPMEQQTNTIGFKFKSSDGFKSFPHPLQFLHGSKHKILDLIKPSQIRITHGDFGGINLSVDPKNVVWLDGYESMVWGPAVTDVAALETILKFHCLDTVNLYELYQLEKWALYPNDFDANLQADSDEINKVLGAIRHLRHQWGKRLSRMNMQEYYASLFFFTMRELLIDDIPDERRPPEIRKLHALFSAAMICHRLENWKNWGGVGWPEPKQVKP